MRIATKLNIVVLAAFAVSVVANYVVLRSTIQPRFEDIERSAASKNHDRVVEALGNLQQSLRASAQDYTFWDNCYEFAKGTDGGEFIPSTLTPAPKMLENVSVDAAVFLNMKREVLWAAGNDGSGGASFNGLVPDLLSLKYRHPYLSGSGIPVVTSGVMHTAKGLALVAVAPIIKGDHTGEPEGVVLMAKLLDIKAIEEMTNVNFKLTALAVLGAGPLDTGQGLKIFDNVIQTSSPVADISGAPVARLTVSTYREVSKAGAAAVQSATLLMMAAGGLVIMALWMFVRHNVVSRITALKDHFAHAVDGGHISESRGNTAADEIGDLARSFNMMAGHVNGMRDAIADSAYLSGVSEWATGTLHNVRNALTPINMYALKMQDLFDQRWCGNIRTALAQIEVVDTPPERREKLNAYVMASSQRMLSSADQAHKLADRIIATSKSIEEIVGEYEKFGRRDPQLASVDIGELVQSVAKSIVQDHDTPVKVSLPTASLQVHGNRTILRQIVANLFVNAIEAMEDQSREKKITVDFKPSQLSGFVDLSVTDNGEGIPVENMRSIFERGFSTRRNKRGGLGLHWCANAAKAMGGSLRARSEGPGCGATLVLCLPATSAELEMGEAA